MTSTMTAPPFQLPDHVPVDLFWDEDLTMFAAQFEDPFIGIQSLQKIGELIYARNVSRGQAGWVPTRYELLNEIFLYTEHFSSTDNIDVGPLMGVDWRLNPLEYDAPEHMMYRMVLQPFFSPKAVTSYEDMIRNIARELISKSEDKKRTNFVDAFASLFPSYVFLDLLGLPREELPQLFEWEHMFTRSTDMAVRAAGAQSILHYLDSLCDRATKDTAR